MWYCSISVIQKIHSINIFKRPTGEETKTHRHHTRPFVFAICLSQKANTCSKLIMKALHEWASNIQNRQPDISTKLTLDSFSVASLQL